MMINVRFIETFSSERPTLLNANEKRETEILQFYKFNKKLLQPPKHELLKCVSPDSNLFKIPKKKESKTKLFITLFGRRK